jgi:hypothetical protein
VEIERRNLRRLGGRFADFEVEISERGGISDSLGRESDWEREGG